MEDDQLFLRFTYSKRKDGIVVRNDGALIPVDDKDNVVTQHFQKWKDHGGKFSDHIPSKGEERFEREQLALREKNTAQEEENRKINFTAPAVPIIGKK